MTPLRLLPRVTRASLPRTLHPSTSSTRTYATETNPFASLNARANDTAPTYRKYMTSKPLTPHLTNTTSTIANDFPSIGSDKPPPELLTSVDSTFTSTKDGVPENTDRMTGGTQSGTGFKTQQADVKSGGKAGAATGKRNFSTTTTGRLEIIGGGAHANAPKPGNADLDVGEIEGGIFKITPLKRHGEDPNTIRARLLYQSRKRGTLESDLLLSTFANANLGTMTPAQLAAYDTFLDENDWDIYYWATQEPTPTSAETAEGGAPELATPLAQGQGAGMGKATEKKVGVKGGEPVLETDEWRKGLPRSGEWAQTVGAFKPAYRPVPARWKNSEILAMLRKHVIDRSAGGVHEQMDAAVEEEGLNRVVKGVGGGGLGMMPELRNFSK